MTKQQIIDFANAKLRGQGNQVDLGSALPEIIAEILGLIPEDLPIASETQLGGVKVGENLSIDENGVLSSQGGSAIPFSKDVLIWDWRNVTLESGEEKDIPQEIIDSFYGQRSIRAYEVDTSEVFEFEGKASYEEDYDVVYRSGSDAQIEISFSRKKFAYTQGA